MGNGQKTSRMMTDSCAVLQKKLNSRLLLIKDNNFSFLQSSHPLRSKSCDRTFCNCVVFAYIISRKLYAN